MSKLNQFKYDWNNAAIATNEYITPEDGQYRVMIENVKYTENDKDGFETDPTFIYTFVVTDGKYKGQKFRRFTTIRNEKSASYFKGDLQKLGIPIPADIEELPEIVTGANGIILDLTVKTRNVNGKDYKDIYFDKRIGKQTASQPPQPRNNAPISQQPPELPPFNPNVYDNDIPF